MGYVANGTYFPRELSKDHTPDAPAERRRILDAGGRICKMRFQSEFGPNRVWLKDYWTPGLAMTRSFGDLIGAIVGINANPDIYLHILKPTDKFLILATDGLWNFLSSKEAVRMVSLMYGSETAESCCKVLIAEAVKR
jgi:serine/threonine protein phosphatase PrpC